MPVARNSCTDPYVQISSTPLLSRVRKQNGMYGGFSLARRREIPVPLAEDYLPRSRTRCPPGKTPVLRCLQINRSTHQTAIRCSGNLNSHPGSMASKKSWMSASSAHPQSPCGHADIEDIQSLGGRSFRPEPVGEHTVVSLLGGVRNRYQGMWEDELEPLRRTGRP
jgi:hypothetical protein